MASLIDMVLGGIGKVTSEFGSRNTGIKGASTNHKGVDIGAPKGTDIFALKDGVVERRRTSSARGNYIEILHDDGTKSLYAHLDKFNIKEGQRVEGGQDIGDVGSTGISSGNHLHFEYLIDGKHVDPLKADFGLSSDSVESLGDVLKVPSLSGLNLKLVAVGLLLLVILLRR